MEIRREVHEGSLSDFRQAALPLAAAIGGVAAPALLYVAVNHGSDAVHGWAVPTATDIAFAVGVLALLGRAIYRNGQWLDAPVSSRCSSGIIPCKRSSSQKQVDRSPIGVGDSGGIVIGLLGIFARVIGLAGCIAILPHGSDSAFDDPSSFAAGYKAAPAIGIGPERIGQRWHP